VAPTKPCSTTRAPRRLCLVSHEKTVVDGGLSQDAVIDAIRIAAVVHGVACALETA